jgi:tetraprenyl-beta-curcumene synthase
MSVARERFLSAVLFVQMALQYWLDVYPRVAREMRYWNRRADCIPDPALRELALEAQRTKRGNVEGACAFAVLVPHSQRASTVKMIVAWQAAYDYVDLLAEQPCADRSANARQLHLALVRALKPATPHDDYYAHYRKLSDADYLRNMVDTTRAIFGNLSNIRPVTERAQRAVVRIVEYQRLNQDQQRALAQWADSETPVGSSLCWWEVAAAGASSLAVLALLAAAADPQLSVSDIEAIERAYYPWIGALHTLLDSLVDLDEDAKADQVSLLVHYASQQELVARTQMIAQRGLRAALGVRHGRRHALILTAMASMYLTAPEAHSRTAAPASRGIREALGELALPSMLVLSARRAISRTSSRSWAKRCVALRNWRHDRGFI